MDRTQQAGRLLAKVLLTCSRQEESVSGQRRWGNPVLYLHSTISYMSLRHVVGGGPLLYADMVWGRE